MFVHCLLLYRRSFAAGRGRERVCVCVCVFFLLAVYLVVVYIFTKYCQRTYLNFCWAGSKCCVDSLPVYPTLVCIRTHKNAHVRMLKINLVVHVRVRWIMQARKDPECIL